jgi:sulfatase maturation enzyme AslB (radical SAM superfamily)
VIAYQDIRDVHLEISSLCNASCPWCPRTFWGYPYNGGYPETNLSLESAQLIFSRDFLKQLTSIRINGNFGDIVMNPAGADIVDYFFEHNPHLAVSVSTNGGARDRQFWTQLAQTPATVLFCIDGLEDTHHLYRQNTVWATVIRNAQIFIAAGGRAVWKMIRFDHNQHQIDQCRQLSQELGFADFELIDDGRNTAPVFDRNGQLTHVLGNYTGPREFKMLFHKKTTDTVLLEDIATDRMPYKSMACQTQILKSIYIAATGDVSPCCFTGFYPKTYGRGQYHEAANAQLIPLIAKNNALEHSLQECVEWFELVENSWKFETYQQGRLIICDDNCGQNP